MSRQAIVNPPIGIKGKESESETSILMYTHIHMKRGCGEIIQKTRRALSQQIKTTTLLF